MDSLRYWVTECHVDGFRFDLASALARELYDVDRLSAFFDVIHQDPVLSQVKLIAEPWDVGPGGYQVGNFPVLWSEWNGIYRDTMRDFWRGQAARRRVRLAPDRLERPLRGRRPPPVRVDQLHHRPRRLHAARPRLLQREAQRGQPGGQPRRDRRQPLLELRRRGRDRRPRDQRAARAPAAQLPRHAAPLPGHADAARRRRVRPHPARQQQRLVPGQRDLLVRLEPAGGERRAARVRAQADRAAARAPGVPPPPVPARRASEEGSGLPDVWWFRTDGAPHDASATGTAGERTVGMFLNGEEIASPDARGQRIARRVVPAAVQRPPRGRARSRCPTGASASAGRSCCRTAEPGAEPTRSRSARSRTGGRRGPLAGAAARAAMTELPRHLPPPARRRASASPRRGSWCRTWPTSASRTCTCRRRSRRGRARRTATTWSTRPRSPTSSAARRSSARSSRAAREAGLGIVLDIVPNHMAVDDANRYWTERALRRKFFDVDAETGPPPPLLRHRPPRRRAPGGPGGVRGDPPRWRSRSCATGSSTGCGSTTRTGWPTRPGYLERLRDGGVEHVWVEKILDPGEQLRDWPVEGTVGYEFLNDVAALFVDPAGEAPLTALWDELSGDPRPFARVRRRGQARAGLARTFARGGRAARARACRSRGDLREAARVAAGLPHLHPSTASAAAEDRGGARRGRHRAGCSTAAARVRHALPADHAAGDGQGRRGHRLLPLRCACSRSTTSAATPAASGSRSRPSTPPTPSAPSASRSTCSSPRRTTPSARATCARGSARSPGWPRSGRRTCARWLELEPLRTVAGARRTSSATSSSRRWSARGRSSPSGSTAYLEKALREAKRTTSWIDPDDGTRRR